MTERALSWAEVATVRLELQVAQCGACPICARDLRSPVLDHSHRKRHKGTGLVRGAICSDCNRLLGVVENNATRCSVPHALLPSTLRRIAAYLEAPPASGLRILHPSERPKRPKLKKASWNRLEKRLKAAGKTCGTYTGRLTKPLAKLFEREGLTPEFYA